MCVKHIVDFYFNTDGNSTEHRISIKVTETTHKSDIHRFIKSFKFNSYTTRNSDNHILKRI